MCTVPSIVVNGISFKVYPKSLAKSGEWVEVSWNYVQNPDEGDWVGVFSPPINDIYRINLALQAPVKLQVRGPLLCQLVLLCVCVCVCVCCSLRATPPPT